MWVRRSEGVPGFGARRGFGTYELLAVAAIVGVLATIAAPSYVDAINKRGIISTAEQVFTFVNRAQSESIKRNRFVTVSYLTPESGNWCIGATAGQVACDCLETNPSAPAYCAIDGVPWILRDSDIPDGNQVRALAGDGVYVLDPVRGILVEPTDFTRLEVKSQDSPFGVQLSVIPTGSVTICIADTSEKIPGFKHCKQGY